MDEITDETAGVEGEARREAARDRRRRTRVRPGKDVEYYREYFVDELRDANRRALSFDEKGRWWEARLLMWGTDRPGVYAEDQLRGWLGYSEEEWPRHRVRFLALHRVRPGGLWVHERTRAEAIATKNRKKTARKRAKAAAQKSWNERRMRAASIARSTAPSTAIHPSIQGTARYASVHPDSERPTGQPHPPDGRSLAGLVSGRLAGSAGSEGG